LKKDYQILIFCGTNIFETTNQQMTINFLVHSTAVPALPGEIRANKILLFYPMRYDYLINVMHKTHFAHIFDTLADISPSCPFSSCLQQKCSKFEISAYCANTGMEMLFH